MSINLLRNRGRGGTQTGMTEQYDEYDFGGGDGGGGGSEGSDAQIESVKKLFLMALGVLCLMSYEWYSLSVLDDQLAKEKVNKSRLTQEKQSVNDEFEKSKSLKSENDELKRKIQIIKKLGKSRLREIKAIDHLQSVIPDLVWINNFQFQENNFIVEGFAASDKSLDDFIQGLSGKSYYKDVILQKKIEQKNERGTILQFTISSSLEKGDA